jgi:hypothetical protein
MGFFSKLGDMGRNGPDISVECQTCGSTYRGNIDSNFPYAICGRCLEREGNQAKSNGDNSTYQQIQLEFRRRGSNWS